MKIQETIEKWIMNDRDSTPLWRLPISEIAYDSPDDPTDGVEIAALAENIRQCGLLNPILVVRQRKNKKKYTLVSGKRRIEAVRLLGRTHITAIVVKSDDESIKKIALSENFMRKRPHFLDFAYDLQAMTEFSSISKIARLFSVKEAYITDRLALLSFTPYEQRIIRLMDISEADALAIAGIKDASKRTLLLEKIMSAGTSCDRDALIAQAKKFPDLRFLQSERIYVKDIRIFLNTVERAAEMMRAAGFDAKVERENDEDSYRFTVTVAKEKYAKLNSSSSQPVGHKNVSRETLPCKTGQLNQQNEPREQKTDVSRETILSDTYEIRCEPIDEWMNKWYNEEVKK